ncbi:MAG TPA: hypothetical protein VHF06_04030 [Pseudonocardiaceae bacterium]|jgi:hypothetical protein|nr:hypothetical protein [Pseudonocardiaceae bacterium]
MGSSTRAVLRAVVGAAVVAGLALTFTGQATAVSASAPTYVAPPGGGGGSSQPTPVGTPGPLDSGLPVPVGTPGPL